MSGEKRAAGESFGSTQLVKRQRSDANLNSGSLTKFNGSALVQAVSLSQPDEVLLVRRPNCAALKRASKGHPELMIGMG